MDRRRQIAALMVAVVAVATTVTGKTPTAEGNVTEKRSPRVFVNTSVPFSVAPQPVKDTQEVAQAKDVFLKTFNMIQDAVTAVDMGHLNNSVIQDRISNSLVEAEPSAPIIDSTTPPTTVSTNSTLAKRGPEPVIGGPPPIPFLLPAQDFFDIFPDPVKEPEYFMPSVHVDPVLMNQFNPPLPSNPFITGIKPITHPRQAGTCYEITILEVESEIFHALKGNVDNNSLSFPSHENLLDAVSPDSEGRTKSKSKSSLGSQAIPPVGTPAFPGISAKAPVAHFKAPQLTFLSRFTSGGGTVTHAGR